MSYLFDSNVIIDYLALKIPDPSLAKLHEIVDNGVQISIISKIEVLGFASGDISTDANNKAFINRTTAFDLSSAIVDQTIAIRKTIRIKLPDAIIAATALIHDLTLLSHNINDFNKIQGLTVLDPHLL